MINYLGSVCLNNCFYCDYMLVKRVFNLINIQNLKLKFFKFVGKTMEEIF